jgi:two-component system response regulator ResD
MSKNVLIVEDEADIRTLYAEVLRDAGYTVIEAADGSTGLQKAFEENWDILLLDIILPGSDGVNVLKKIKANDALKSKPVILLTNLGVDHVIHDCFELGASGYLIKSEITPDKIVEEVTNYLAPKDKPQQKDE